MNEADASGSGAAPASPAEPQATSAATAPTSVSLDQVKGLIADTLTGFKNEFFASARKAGVLGKDKPNGETPATPPAPQSAAAPASSGLSATDVEAMLEQERVITKAQLENKLTDAQIKRMKSALKAEKPEDVSTWASSYLTDLGLVRPTDTQTTSTVVAPTIAPNAAPVSDKGSPAPSGGVGWRHEFASNPVGMSRAAREQMDAELGAEKARKQRLEASQRQASMRVDWKA